MTVPCLSVGLSFQSTPPVKAATLSSSRNFQHFRISIHAAREGGDDSTNALSASYVISIHAAREGGDCVHLSVQHAHGISIHAAREGGDRRACCLDSRQPRFQSTPPVKAATLSRSGG